MTSRPVLSCPSACSRTRLRRSFRTSVCCASAMPSSNGSPAPLRPVHAAAPVPPSPPEMTRWSALALTTPAAITPTPTSDTSFTDTSPWRLAFFRSWISWARSSIESMSWCGGGEMRPTPSVVPRHSAMYAETLCPGSSPPSPGLAPCAILIWIWSALAK